jgi:elongation factor 3
MMDSVRKSFDGAINGKTKPERLAAAQEFGAAVVKAGLAASVHELKLNDMFNENFNKEGKKAAPCREGALYCITEVCQQAPGVCVFLMPCIPMVLDLQGDKIKTVASAAVDASAALFKKFDDNSAAKLIPELLKNTHSFQGTVDRFEKICDMCVSSPLQISFLLSDAIPAVVPFMNDIKKEVGIAATKCLRALCDTCTNPDMEPFIPELVKCMKDVKEIPETVFRMASTTFVAEVDGATLSIMVPVLSKGLAVTSETKVKRQCSRIIENMSKLVDEPRYLNTFLPKILPLLDAAKLGVSDPECREVCGKAAEALQKKGVGAKPLSFNIAVATQKIEEILTRLNAAKAKDAANVVLLELVASQATALNEINEFDIKEWTRSIEPVLVNLAGFEKSQATTFISEILKLAVESRVEKEEEEHDDGAEVLCDLPFGLAYGNKVLLRKTKLKLLRGHKYGLLGQNDSGKTSLLQALADYKIDGFPTADICRTVFVATDIKTELADFSVLEYMFNDPLLRDCGISKDDMEKTLISVGFKEGAPANTTQKVGTLSGGWRMKLALSRAMLLKADILLLDEPTNHLDAYNVKWVETYLLSIKNVTCIMVSHDSGLLTRVCTDVIEIAEMRLNYFRGNLDEFVAARPDAKCYFELAKEGKIDFTFPPPGTLAGINSKGKAILKMTNITFTYPGATKAQLNNVTIQVCLSSRVACVGENGAGKSTMIKLLTGELEPDEGSGEVWKHPNCRVGYIAQHAFHHIEKHLDESANDYIRTRYANGGDTEQLVKVTNLATPEEVKMMETPYEIGFTNEDATVTKRKLVVDRFTEARRENKQKKNAVEYETVFHSMTGNHWIERDILEKMGFEKVLNAMDERIALRATQFGRPLTKENVQKHIADVGLAAEFSTHMRMGALSGGQKVKVVLASALWTKPHILILDEPTNYLDRESLGALARAIRAFEGGVVMITHNSQFCDNLCPVVWHLQNNTLDVKGDAEWMAEAAKEKIVVASMAEEDMVDRFGNTVVLTAGKKTYSKKEQKMKKLRRMKRFKETGDDFDSDEE